MAKTRREWIKRPAFRVRCDLWLDAHPDKTKEDLALVVGVKNGSVFKQYYSGKECPSSKLIAKMAAGLDCAESELADDADQPVPPGVDADLWASSEIRVRAQAETMMRVAKAIPPEKMEDFIAMLERGQETAYLVAKGKPLSRKG